MKRTVSLFVFISLFYVNHIIAQDTLSGNYTSLKIPTGLHVIKDVVRVTGAFEVDPGAKIEMIDAGLIVCEGSVSIKGLDKNIEFFGKKNLEGIGIVIKNIDSNKVIINNTIFKSLQLPILFDFGWNRAEVDISDNIFMNNVGKISVLQVLNPPFNFNTDSVSNTFKLINNL